jgi:hypothetical protein
MSIFEPIFHRLVLAFPNENKRSIKAAAIILNIGRLMPPSYIYPLPPPSTSEERLELIRFILKKETGFDYTSNEILGAHNILMGNREIQEELNFDFAIDKLYHYLNEYKCLQPNSEFAKNFTPLLLLPHRTVCTQCNCHLKVSFQSCAKVVYCTKIQTCLLYKADCYQCRKSYRVSSIYSMDEKQTFVTMESQKSDYIHFSGSIVFSKEILIMFSSELICNYATFEGFASSILKTITRINSNNGNMIAVESLERNLEAVWLYYELANFILMTSKSTEISFPYAMSEGRTKVKGKPSSRAIFIERNINWIYHVFTVFWSNHEKIFGSCKCGNCSRVMVIDGHQKP